MKALEDLTRSAMGCGTAYLAGKARRGELDPTMPLPDAFDSEPADFLAIRRDLVRAVDVEIADRIEHVWGEFADEDLEQAARKIAAWLREGGAR